MVMAMMTKKRSWKSSTIIPAGVLTHLVIFFDCMNYSSCPHYISKPPILVDWREGCVFLQLRGHGRKSACGCGWCKSECWARIWRLRAHNNQAKWEWGIRKDLWFSWISAVLQAETPPISLEGRGPCYLTSFEVLSGPWNFLISCLIYR